MRIPGPLRSIRPLQLLALVWLTLPSCQHARGPWGYPEARQADVVDVYHGVEVPDPYRWLEDPDAPETLAWVEAQNELTRRFVRTPSWARLRERLAELHDYARLSVPVKRGGKIFYTRAEGTQNQPRLLVEPAGGGEASVVLDPNRWSEDGTAALGSFSPSRDGARVAYARSMHGSDWEEIRVRDLASGEDGPEVLEWCKFSAVAWKPDGSGFFYNRYPDPTGRPPEQHHTHNKVYFHALGTPQSSDALVYERPDAELLSFYPQVSQDGRYLVLTVYQGTDPKNRIYVRKLDSSEDFVRLLDGADASYTYLENIGTTFYFRTDLDAPRYRIVAIDLTRPQPKSWREVVAELGGSEVIEHVEMVNNRFVCAVLDEAHSRLRIYDLNGRQVREIALPGIGSVFSISGEREDAEFFYDYTSCLQPFTVYRYRFESGRSERVWDVKQPLDPSAYVTRQVFYRSKDGTRIPMSITHRKDLPRDGSAPALLYGYGGFNISLTPYFSIRPLLMLERGGVFAVANLRGGGEYGEAWHQAGILSRKQNVFDDFIAAAEHLLREGYTQPERLAIMGGSNGGLLTAACMLQRPELFGAVVSAVPVIDMLRYHKFTVGRFWVSDYGNAEQSKAQFDFLRAYSPLHNVEQGKVYPPVLITTADTDDRVVPAHGKKFAAALQQKADPTHPVLLRVETKAGHGRGKPTSKRIEEYADIYGFLFRVLGVD
ncbi:MAG: S9 family peptidase [Deltaproteobacteria bacterium]|nr:S9 family peptidase [Deltaproteobacteria bacterium]